MATKLTRECGIHPLEYYHEDVLVCIVSVPFCKSMAEGRVLFRFFPIVVDGLGPVELVYKFFVHHMFHPKRGDSRKRALPAHSESRLVESQDYFDDTKRNTRASAQD